MNNCFECGRETDVGELMKAGNKSRFFCSYCAEKKFT